MQIPYEQFHSFNIRLGPLVVAYVFNSTGSYRQSMSILVVFFILGGALLMFYNHKAALEEKKVFEDNENHGMLSHPSMQGSLSPYRLKPILRSSH